MTRKGTGMRTGTRRMRRRRRRRRMWERKRMIFYRLLAAILPVWSPTWNNGNWISSFTLNWETFQFPPDKTFWEKSSQCWAAIFDKRKTSFTRSTSTTADQLICRIAAASVEIEKLRGNRAVIKNERKSSNYQNSEEIEQLLKGGKSCRFQVPGLPQVKEGLPAPTPRKQQV